MFNTSSAGATTTLDRSTGAGWEALPAGAGNLRVRLVGVWTLASGGHPVTGFDHFLRSDTRQISFDSRDLWGWDSVLVQFLCELEGLAEAEKIAVDRSGLPGGAARLVALARAVPERKGARRDQA